MLMVAQENAGKYDTKKRYKPSSNSSRKPLFFSEMKAQKESLLVCLFIFNTFYVLTSSSFWLSICADIILKKKSCMTTLIVLMLQ